MWRLKSVSRNSWMWPKVTLFFFFVCVSGHLHFFPLSHQSAISCGYVVRVTFTDRHKMGGKMRMKCWVETVGDELTFSQCIGLFHFYICLNMLGSFSTESESQCVLFFQYWIWISVCFCSFSGESECKCVCSFIVESESQCVGFLQCWIWDSALCIFCVLSLEHIWRHSLPAHCDWSQYITDRTEKKCVWLNGLWLWNHN